MAATLDLSGTAGPERLTENARRSFPAGGHGEAHAGHGGHGEPAVNVRETTYRGYRIRVETSYRITVDDRPVTGHIAVGGDGQVHYHSIPNQQFDSAVDMVRRIIDLTPPGGPEPPGPGPAEPPHAHSHQHGRG